MSPEGQVRGRKIMALNNLYTAILALAMGIVVATIIFVVYKCYFQYDTVFTIP